MEASGCVNLVRVGNTTGWGRPGVCPSSRRRPLAAALSTEGRGQLSADGSGGAASHIEQNATLFGWVSEHASVALRREPAVVDRHIDAATGMVDKPDPVVARGPAGEVCLGHVVRRGPDANPVAHER